MATLNTGQTTSDVYPLRGPSFRPSDDLILTATRFSGIPAFIDLIDLETIQKLKDPLKVDLDKLVQSS